jgi:hypothetical protein
MAGCGKTMLSSTIIAHLNESCEGDVSSIVAYFFFGFNDAGMRSLKAIVASLIMQLLQKSKNRPASLEETMLKFQCGLTTMAMKNCCICSQGP